MGISNGWRMVGWIVAAAPWCACSQSETRGDSSMVDASTQIDAPLAEAGDDETPADTAGPLNGDGGGLADMGGDGGSSNDSSISDAEGDRPKPPDGSVWCDAAPPRGSQSDASAPEYPFCYLPSSAPVVCLAAGCSVPPMPVADCSNKTWRTVLSYPDGLQSVQADAQGVYWQSPTALLMQKAGTATQEVLVFKRESPFAIDDDFVYFEGSADAGPTFIEKIRRDRTERTRVGSGGVSGSPLLLDRDRIYFNGDDGRVASIPKSGGSSVDAGIGVVPINRVRFDDTHFFWVESSDVTLDTIKRAAKGSPVVETLASGLPEIRGLVLEGSGVLLLSGRNILEIPKEGGCPRVLAITAADWLSFSKWHTAFTMAADETSIYWWGMGSLGDISLRSLWRAPRTGGAMASMYSNSSGSGPDLYGLFLLPNELLLIFEKSIGAIDRR